VASERVRRIGKKLLALSVGVLVSFALAECCFRVIGIGSAVFHRPDATYGMVLIPGAEGWWVAEGRSYVTINGDGFRDVGHARAKPDDTVRIAVLGDSYAEALQVPLDKNFWWLLGSQLGDCDALAGKKVEMLNFGISGFSTAQEYLLLQKRVWDFDPDIVLLAFLTGNDVADNHPALGAVAAPFYRFEGDELVLDSSRAHSLGTGGRMLHWMVRHSRVFQVINQMRINLKVCGKLQACGGDLDMKKGEAGLRNQIYLEPADDTWREAWRVTEELLRRMRDEVAAHGARFFVATLSNGIQVHPDPTIRDAFRDEIHATDLFYPDRRIAELGQREGIAVYTLAPEFLRYAEAEQVHLHGWKGPALGQGHWNEDGHRLAADALAPWMCKNLGDVNAGPAGGH
jgi:hypothetical protein